MWKRKRSWTADAMCRLDTGCAPVGDSEQEIDFPWAMIPNSDGIVHTTIFFSTRRALAAYPPVQGVRPSQLREAHHGAPVPAGTGASQQILLAARGKSATQSAREKERRIRRVGCVIPAAVPTSGTHLCSLSAPASPSHSWELAHQNRLAFSRANRRHRVRHPADPDHSQFTDREAVATESSP